MERIERQCFNPSETRLEEGTRTTKGKPAYQGLLSNAQNNLEMKRIYELCSITPISAGVDCRHSLPLTTLRLASKAKLNLVVRPPVLNWKRNIPMICDVASGGQIVTVPISNAMVRSQIVTGTVSTRSKKCFECALGPSRLP